jgi:hypothetical protein
MGASRRSAANLLSFISNVQAGGATVALQALNFGALAGRSTQEVFLGLTDYICPVGGTVDDGIARDAFVKTIVDVAAIGGLDFDALTVGQLQTVFELFATHAIMGRICNDIGTNALSLPENHGEAANLQRELQDFVRGAVADAMQGREVDRQLTLDQAQAIVDGVYTTAFDIMQSLGDEEADQ